MSKLRVPLSERDHVLGPEDAPLTLVEYGDFQCPHCIAAHPQVKHLVQTLGDSVRFAFRHFPITEAHEFALLGAVAAEAAGRQGQFWAMHDALYENPEELGPEGVLELAEALGLSMPRFRTDLEDRGLEQRIRQDFIGGARSGVAGTPWFFVDGETYRGPLEVGTFLSMLRGRSAGGPEQPELF
jgi:protein-disulfide isomerase